MSYETDVCVHCGETRENHCTFVAAVTPPGCVCDPFEYGNPAAIPPVCTQYEQDPNFTLETRCIVCEHDKECHQ